MPFIEKQNTKGGVVALWHITETIAELLPRVSRADATESSRFGSELRRRQWLAWRTLLREMVPGAEVCYNEVGAPVLTGGGEHIAVSHSGQWAVVMVCAERCAVDIESADRNFARIASKYISGAEERFITGDANNVRAIFWSAKETLYKYSGCKELSLSDDIEITCFDPAGACLHGAVHLDEGRILETTVAFRITGGMVMAWTPL